MIGLLIKKLKNKPESSAFGLIETLLACGVMIMVAAASASLGLVSLRGTTIAKHKTEAYMLAQEAMEQIKYERDSFWNNENWASSQPQDWGYFWTEESCSTCFKMLAKNINEKCIYINHLTKDVQARRCNEKLPKGAVRYQLTVGTEGVPLTNLGDYININKEDITYFDTSNQIYNLYRVTVRVTWMDYGQPQEVTLASYLGDWKARY